MRPFFFVGNRRSGTTMLVKAINLHEDVFCAYERDLLWMLYLLSRDGGLSDTYTGHPVGGRLHRWETLGWYGLDFLIAQKEGVTTAKLRSMFFDIAWRYGQEHWGRKKKPVWIGEKNPEETCLLRGFAEQVFPDAKYIHLVRHPAACVGSKVAFAKNARFAIPAWQKPADELLDDWMLHERRVLEMSDEHKPILTIRYEDLCQDPNKEMGRLSEFLGVKPWPDLRNVIGRSANSKYRLSVPHRVSDVMKAYGYL